LRSDGIGYLAAALVAGLLIAVLPGCEGESEPALIASAKSHLDKKDPKSAIIQLKSALQKNPQSGEARYLLGQALLTAGDASGAILELNKARELKFDDNLLLPTLAKALLATGQATKVTEGFENVTLADHRAAAELKATVARAYFVQGTLDGTLRMVTAALQLNPKNVGARMLQARLTAGRGDFDKAVGIADELIQDEPQQGDPWALKGELLWIGKSDMKGGEGAFRRALTVDPRHMRAHEALLRLLQQKGDIAGFKAEVSALKQALPGRVETRFFGTQLALMEGDMKLAQEGAQQLLKAAPRSAQVLQLAGAIELRSGAMAQAQTHLKQAIQLFPNEGGARLLLAEAQLRTGQTSPALRTLEPLLQVAKPAVQVLALAAQAYMQDGDMAKAEAYYTQAAKVDPSDPKARVALAMTQFAKGNAEAGFAQLESLAAADKTTYADLALIAARARSNDLHAALRAVDHLQAKIPDTALPYLVRGRILRQLSDAAGAKLSFEKALSLDAVNFSAISELAAMDLADKKPDEARKRFETLLARDPTNARARLAIVDLRQRVGAKPQEIEALLTSAIAANPEEVDPRLLLVEHHMKLRHAKAGLAAAQDAVAAFPDNLLALDALGRTQRAAGESLQAIQTFQKIAASQATIPLPHLRLAETYIASKDYTAAAQSLKRALEIAPKLLVAQLQLVQVMLARGQVSEARAVARQVQRQRPQESAGYLIESEIHARQKNWDLAIAAFRLGLERDRSTELATRLHALFVLAGRSAEATRFAASWEAERPQDAEFVSHMGMVAVSRKDYAAAEARFRRVLVLRPDDPAMLNNISWVLLQQGKPGALPLTERANQLAPGRPAFMDTLASALAVNKQLKEALEWQRKAVDKDPDSPSLRLNLAKRLIDSGDRTQARTELEKLVTLGGRFDQQGEVEALLKKL
jgi:putative PEP-CTERM system TPR-repeat lipoprotein